MNQMYIGKIEIYPEICCESCGEIIHNHLDCPVCKKKYAETENYGNLIYYGPPYTIICNECKTKFITYNKPYSEETIWNQIKND